MRFKSGKTIITLLLIIVIVVFGYLINWSNKSSQSPPKILDLNVTANIQRLTISFTIVGENDTKTTITVEPVTYPSLKEDAFPQEAPKTIHLSGSGYHNISVSVLGGREYRVVIQSCTKNLHNSTVQTTPYVREYEDLAERLAEMGIVFSAPYMPWNMQSVLGEKWKGDTALLGKYDTVEDIVQWKHIDWARGHGIYVFWADWTNYAYTPAGGRIKEVTFRLLEKGMTVGIMIGSQVDMHFTEGYPSVDLRDPWNEKVLLDVIKIAIPLMKHPNYYRIDGKPALFIWNEGIFFNRAEAYKEIRELIKRECGVEPYIIADILPRITPGRKTVPGTPEGNWYIENLLLRKNDGGDKFIDAYTSWIGFYSVQGENALTPEEIGRYIELYEEHAKSWRNYSRSRGKCFIPTVSPGFDRTHDKTFNQPHPVPRDEERFAEMLKIALEVMGDCREIRIDTWNDFYENTFVEPSEKDGFTYLEIIWKLSSLP